MDAIFSLHDYPLFSYLILPIFIFLARVIDVSIGTMRVIFVSRGFKLLATFCGFFEILIWLLAITQIMKNLNNFYNYIAYATGFASGNYIGMIIEEKIALGNVILRVVTRNELQNLRDYLKDQNFGVTILDAEGHYGNVKILFTVIPRQEVERIISFIKELNPQAFYTIEDIRYVNEKYLFHRKSKPLLKTHLLKWFMRKPFRKGK
ncbi:DUF2179 domain-containing protein [Candidatus Latescibacterota bacterium]